jgi:hypothetical protein
MISLIYFSCNYNRKSQSTGSLFVRKSITMSSQGSTATNNSNANTGTPNGASNRPIPKPSPFKRGLTFESAKKKARTTQTLFIKHVQPQVNENDITAGVHGILIGSATYAERLMTAPLYNRNLREHVAFLDTVQPVGRVFSLINPDGTKMMKGSYQHKAICILFPRESVADMNEQAIRDFVNETIGPAIALLPDYTATDPPKVEDGAAGYTRHDTWNQCINDEDIRSFINIEMRGDNYVTAGAFMRASQENLYSFYAVGEIDDATRARYELTVNHMNHADAVNLGLIVDNNDVIEVVNDDNAGAQNE